MTPYMYVRSHLWLVITVHIWLGASEYPSTWWQVEDRYCGLLGNYLG